MTNFTSGGKRPIVLLTCFALLAGLQVLSIILGGAAGGDNVVGNDVGSYDESHYTSFTSSGDVQQGSSDEQTQPTAEAVKVIIPKLINTTNKITADFEPTNLVEIGDAVKGTATLQLNATAFEAYKVMYADMSKAEGVTIPMIISGYRSYSRQKQLYDAKVKQYGAGQKVTAEPGTSEHQYSASIDLSTDGTCQNDFNDTSAGKWIAENSYKYGFVVRYPTDKKEVTGINYEPWHIRFVGVEHATKMHELNMCLEEYVVYLREKYPDAIEEQSPDDFPVPRWAGDTEGVHYTPAAETTTASADDAAETAQTAAGEA